MRKRRRFGKIQKDLFSEKYNGLPLKQKISIRRKLEQDCTNLIETAEKLADDVKKLNQSFSVNRKKSGAKTIGLGELKSKRYQLSQRGKKLRGQIIQAEQYAKQYFNDFYPWAANRHGTANPFEIILHKTHALIGEFDVFYRSMRDRINIVEHRQRHER